MFVTYFYLWFLLLVFTYILYLFGYLHFSEKKYILNNFVGFAALFFVFMNILLFLILMVQIPKLQQVTLPLFTIGLLLPVLCIGCIIMLSSLFMYFLRLINKDKYLIALEKRKENKSHNITKWKKDFFRKINHVLIFIGLFIVWYISYNIIRDVIIKNEGNDKEIKIDPAITNMLYLYLRLLTTPKSIAQVLFDLEWFYYVLFFFFYIFCLIMLTNELTRKTKYIAFVFNFIPKFTSIFSEEEKKSYCSYLYFGIGQLFASFLCPPMVFFAILGMSSIGDLMASQIGIRYGKKKFLWNQEKTYEGTLAGTLTTFIIGLLFIGPFYALMFSLAFFIFDMITTKPLNLNDNLLIPIGCAIIYVFVRYITDINYFSLILEFF